MTKVDWDADYIVIGGGTAGSVVAARLSENPRVRVLLLEAGGKATDLLVQIPAGMAKMIGNPKYDWSYQHDPDPTIAGRNFNWPAGRMLGGGSSINGQVHIRGTKGDYDNWERLGATGWDYDSVLPYFIKSETFTGPSSQTRGEFGPMSVQPMRDPHPLNRNFLDACSENGLPTLRDYADGKMEGAFLTVTTQRGARRCSTEKAYLRPARRRSNLRIVTDAQASRVIFEGRHAVGVEASVNGRSRIFRAALEIIVSSGAIGSPGLLLRSGIGPAEELKSAGVDVVHEAPEVGKNLVEHLSLSISKYVNVSTYNAETGPMHMVKHALKYFLFGTGPLSSPAVQSMALVRTRPDLAEPDVKINFGPAAWSVAASTRANIVFTPEPAVSITCGVCRPNSKGRVRLSPGDKHGVRITHNFFSDERDLKTMIDAGKFVNDLFRADAWRDVVVGDRAPHPVPTDDAGWRDYVRNSCTPSYHPAGTCRMGSDDRAVVDPDGRVRGVRGLRVADASIMPALLSANTNAPTIMIGEKIAAAIGG